jgi:S1-C subfamily serine protease
MGSPRVLCVLGFCALLLSQLCQSQNSQAQTRPLSNADVIEMVSIGLGDDVIIEKIQTATALNFDTSVEGLKELKAGKVSDAVLKVMLSPHSAPTPGSGRLVDELSTKFRILKNGVFTVWSETGHGTGFAISSDGLILTNQHVVGPSEYIALQFDEKTKIPAILLAADPEKDVAVLWADIGHVNGAEPLPIAASDKNSPSLVEGERVFTIGSPLNQQKILTSGICSKVEKTAILSDININHGNSGGPLFNSQGEVVGITTFKDPDAGGGVSGILKIEEAAQLVSLARLKMAATTPPNFRLLPVDPDDSFPIDAIKTTIQQAKFDAKPYVFDEGDFQVLVITPPLQYRLEFESQMRAANEKAHRNRKTAAATGGDIQPLDDLRTWGEYVGEYKPILTILAKPKMRETTGSLIVRSLAASGGGYGGPAKLRFKTDFYRMRLMCGDKEVEPILPGKIPSMVNVHSAFVNATDATYEGLYTFPADAISPACGKVVLQLFSEKKPESAASKEINPKTVSRVWDDFQPYRALHPPA